MSFEAWQDFRAHEAKGAEPSNTTCYFCGRRCSGDTTTPLAGDDDDNWPHRRGDETPICDDQADCERVIDAAYDKLARGWCGPA